MAALQGLLTGATVVFLSRSCNEAQQQRKHIIWEKLTLEFNHILLLLGTVLKQMQVVASPVSLITRAVFVLTPILLAIALSNTGIISRDSAEFADVCNKIYTVAAFVISLQMLIFGNFWLGALSLATIVCGFSAQQRHVSPIFTALATLVFFGFTAQIFLGASLLNKAVIVLTAGLIFIPKIYNWLFPPQAVAEIGEFGEGAHHPTQAQPPPAARPVPAPPAYYAAPPPPACPTYYVPPPLVVVMPQGSARHERREETPPEHRPIYGSGFVPLSVDYRAAANAAERNHLRTMDPERSQRTAELRREEEHHAASRVVPPVDGNTFSPSVVFAQAAPAPRAADDSSRRAATAALRQPEEHFAASRIVLPASGSVFSPPVPFRQAAPAPRADDASRRATTAALGTEETHRASRPVFGGGGSSFSPGVGFGQQTGSSRNAGGNPFSAAPSFGGRPPARGGQGRR